MSTLSISPPSIATQSLPSPIAESRDSVIKQIALRSLADLAIALASTAICIPFVATTTIAAIVLGVAIAGVLLNAIIRIVAARFLSPDDSETCPIDLPCGFSTVECSIQNPAILLHEAGHFCAAKLLFNGSPTIHLDPFECGITSYSTMSLSTWGRQTGYRRSICLITMAGTALVLLASVISLAVGLKLRESFPTAGYYLIAFGLIQWMQHFEYAISVFWTDPKDLGNDFVRLKSLGIHPIISCVAVVAIPALMLGSAYLVDRAINSKSSC